MKIKTGRRFRRNTRHCRRIEAERLCTKAMAKAAAEIGVERQVYSLMSEILPLQECSGTPLEPPLSESGQELLRSDPVLRDFLLGRPYHSVKKKGQCHGKQIRGAGRPK